MKEVSTLVILVFDCLRSPYDFANILQVALATGECEIHVCGNSMNHTHRKIAGKVGSWSAKIRKEGLPEIQITYHDSLDECVSGLRAKGIRILGTSPYASKSIYDTDLSGTDYAIVFGTETSGISKGKQLLMDEMLSVPMTDQIDFMTLSVVVPIVAYEALRQQKLGSRP